MWKRRIKVADGIKFANNLSDREIIIDNPEGANVMLN